MSLIEGIGDDFLYLVILLLLVGVISLAWISTNVNQIPFPTTLFIIERRTSRRNQQTDRSSPSPTPAPTVSSSSSSQESDAEPTEPEDSHTTELSSPDPIQVTEEQNDLSAQETAHIDSSDDQKFKFVIKFLNDTQKLISAHPNDTISKIKQSYFASELANDQIVRFIYQGRELQDDETLRVCNIRDQTIIHCQISARRRPSPNRANDGFGSNVNFNANNFDSTALIDAPPINLSSHFIVLLTLALGFIWYLRIKYRLLFSPFSTIVLILVTIIFLIFTCGSLLTSSRRSINHPGSGTTIAIAPIQHVHLD